MFHGYALAWPILSWNPSKIDFHISCISTDICSRGVQPGVRGWIRTLHASHQCSVRPSTWGSLLIQGRQGSCGWMRGRPWPSRPRSCWACCRPSEPSFPRRLVQFWGRYWHPSESQGCRMRCWCQLQWRRWSACSRKWGWRVCQFFSRGHLQGRRTPSSPFRICGQCGP